MQAVRNTASWVAAKASQLETHIAEEWLGGWSPALVPDMTGKVALVTGSNSGMGYETARKLAENGAEVLMVSRDAKKGEDAAQRIRAEVGKAAKLHVLECDMMSLRNVLALAQDVKRTTPKLDLLIGLAGVFYPGPVAFSADGIEQTLAVNYYAHALLVLSLLDLVRNTPGSRVVLMSSAMEVVGRLSWNNLKGERSLTSGLVPYGTSKLMLTMFAAELSRRVPKLDVFAVHPGLVATPLHAKSDPRYPLNLIFKAGTALFGSTPREGAKSTLYAATEPSLQGKRWAFFAPTVLPLNLWPTTERPFYRSGRVANPRLGGRLFDSTQDLLGRELGSSAPPRVPPSLA